MHDVSAYQKRQLSEGIDCKGVHDGLILHLVTISQQQRLLALASLCSCAGSMSSGDGWERCFTCLRSCHWQRFSLALFTRPISLVRFCDRLLLHLLGKGLALICAHIWATPWVYHAHRRRLTASDLLVIYLAPLSFDIISGCGGRPALTPLRCLGKWPDASLGSALMQRAF